MLRLTADDGEVRTFDEATVIVTTPVVTIMANAPLATEFGLVPGQFTVTRTGSTAAALTVFFSKSGTATEGADYQSIGGQVVIPASSASTTVTITPLADNLSEGDETVTITLAANAAYALGASSSDTVTIADLPVDDWRKQQFGANANDPAIAGDNADPNHDDLVNLLEYALGLDPNATAGNGQPVFARTAGEVSLTFTRRVSAPDIMLTMEWSDDLSSPGWSTAGVTLQVTPLDATRETVKASVPIGASVQRKFLRLKVTRP